MNTRISKLIPTLLLMATGAFQSTLHAAQGGYVSSSGGAAMGAVTPAFPSQPNGKFTTSVEDIRVKVLGGYVNWSHEYDGNKWHFNSRWGNLKLEFDQVVIGASSGGGGGGGGGVAAPSTPAELFGGTTVPGLVKTEFFSYGFGAAGPLLWINRNGVPFKADSDYASYSLEGGNLRYLIKPLLQPTHPNPAMIQKAFYPTSMQQIDAGVPLFRWFDKQGDSIDFDKYGSILSYADANGIQVKFEYEDLARTTNAPAVRRIKRVLDHYNNPALVLVYDAADPTKLSEVRDVPRDGDTLPMRSVKYSYDSAGSISSVVDVRGNTRQYGYDAKSRLTSITDQEGRQHKIEYGPTNKMSKETDAAGGVTDYTYDYDRNRKEFFVRILYPETTAGRRKEERWYDVQGQLLQIDINGKMKTAYSVDDRTITKTNLRGQVTKSVRNEYHMITETLNPDGSSYKTSYDAHHLHVVETTDELGVKTKYSYDSKGNLLKIVDAVGRADEIQIEYVRNNSGRVTSLTYKGKTETNGTATPDATWLAEYDSYGNFTKITDPEGFSRRYEYDRQGSLAKIIDAKGNQTSFENDASGRSVKRTNALGNTGFVTYDKVGNMVELTDARQKTFKRIYDALNREIKKIDPNGAEFKTEYNNDGKITKIEDAAGIRTSIENDLFRRPAKVTGGKDSQVTLEYLEENETDVGGPQPSKVLYPTFERRTRYNDRNRPSQKTDLDGQDARTESFGYDAVGNRTTYTQANGKTYQYEYSAYGELIKVTDPLGNVLRMLYDARGNLIEITDANGQKTKFEYNRRNLLVKETDPLGNETSYNYDENGWQTKTLFANGKYVEFEYDANGRLTEQREYNATKALLKKTNFTYDADDNLTAWNDGTYSAAITYDDVGRVSSEEVNYRAFRLSHSYTYYANNQVKTYTGPDGITISYQYDANGQLERVSIPNEGDIAVTDWQWVARKKVLLPGGTEQRFEYDGLMMLKGLKVVNPGQATVFELENRYGKMHEVTETTRDAQTIKYSYDEALRLTQVDGGLFSGLNEGYTVDAAGNRLTDNATANATWNYDAAGQLKQRGNVRYEYDAAGNLIKKIDTVLTEPQRTTEYSYDALNRLQEVRNGAGELIARYAYDPFDRRLSKTLANGSVTFYVYGDSGLLAETNGDGVVQLSYGWHPEHESSTYPLFARAPDPAKGANQYRYVYYHNDHIGTPLRITDRAGQVIWKADYNGFGYATVSTTTENALISNLRFPGQYFDQETGLHYNDRRYYDPATGRYLTRDPLGFDGGSNLYAYANHNPITYTDPTGEIIPCLMLNYLRCMASCMLMSAASDAVFNCGDVNWGDNAKDCALDCVLGMLPIPNPCGKLGKFLSGVGGGLAGGGGFNSFTADTIVHVKPLDAKDEDARRGISTHKLIGDVKPGDKVLAFAEWKKGSKKGGNDERFSYETVSNVFMSEKIQKIVAIELDNGDIISATEGHPFLTNFGWRDAAQLKSGSYLLGSQVTASDDNDAFPHKVVQVSVSERKLSVVNLEVLNAHTFFVGMEGVLVHNGFGSYTCRFKSGRTYDGKGDRDRMNQSGREHAAEYGDEFLESASDWTPASSDAESFEQEYRRQVRNGGPQWNRNGDGSNYNKIWSPGKKKCGC